MSNKSAPPRVLLILGTLFLIFYSIFFLVNLFPAIHANSLEKIFYWILLITLLGLWGLWNQKKIFNQSFWKVFLFVQLIVPLYYFYMTYSTLNGLPLVLINKILLLLPLCIIIYFYAFKNYEIWNIPEEVRILPNNKIALKSHSIFLIGAILITLLYNPFPQDKLSPAEYNSLGFQAAGRGDSAAEKRFYFKGLKAAKKMHMEDTKDVAKIYHNLSIYYDEKFNEKASIFYDLKAIAIYEKLLKENKINKKSSEYHMLAEGYYVLGTNNATKDAKTNIYYLNKAMTIFKDLKDDRWISMCNQGLGTVYSKNKDYRLSKFYFEQASAIAKKEKINDVLADTYKQYADSLFAQKKYKQAEEFAKKAINTFEKNDKKAFYNERQLGNSYNVLAKIYAAQGNCNEANKYYSIGIPMMNKSVRLTEFEVNRTIRKYQDECQASNTSNKDNA